MPLCLVAMLFGCLALGDGMDHQEPEKCMEDEEDFSQAAEKGVIVEGFHGLGKG